MIQIWAWLNCGECFRGGSLKNYICFMDKNRFWICFKNDVNNYVPISVLIKLLRRKVSGLSIFCNSCGAITNLRNKKNKLVVSLQNSRLYIYDVDGVWFGWKTLVRFGLYI